MDRLIGVVLAILATQPAIVPPSRQGNGNEIKTRLAAYENRDPRLPPDPDALAQIARLVMAKAARAEKFWVWTEECASRFASSGEACSARLTRVLNDPARPIAARTKAGTALVRRGDNKAADSVFNVLKNLRPAGLTALVQDVRLLPAPQATPLLLRMLESPDAVDKVAACRALGASDSGDVRQALSAAVAEALPGLEVWSTCMVARARQREPDSLTMISGYSHYMEEEALLDAAGAMVEVGNDQGVEVLRKVTREASPLTQLGAADLLAERDLDAAVRVVDAKLDHPQPEVRARALVVERRLNRAPSAIVRRMLVDPDELVQLRAAEAVLDWAARITR